MQDLCTTLRFSPYFQGYFHDLFRFCLVFSSLIRTSERCSKVFPFDNKNKKIDFCFVLCSLIRTFVP